MNMTPIDYRRRMDLACAELAEGAMLLLAQPVAIRNANQEHMYRQESFLHYLTGFDEPESALLILGHRPEGERYVMFLRDNDAVAELWGGKRLGVDAAPMALRVDQAYPISQLWDKLPELLDGALRLYYHLGRDEKQDRHLIAVMHALKSRRPRRLKTTALISIHDPLFVAGRLRLRKQPEEIARMQHAAAITRAAFARVYAEVRPGMNEREVWAILLAEFMRGGADMEAYHSIVAGGANACCLHYHGNNQPLADHSLLLVDAGAQYAYYASDVTRTLPVGRRFTAEQKAVYAVVLEAQLSAIAAAQVGATLPQIHDAAVDKLVDGMIDMRFFKESRQEIIEQNLYRRYYPHSTSHWIGMDVHDVGEYHEDDLPIALQPGMYFSVEPGIYIDPNDALAPVPFRGIGVRIEDDVLITDKGPHVITDGIAKDVDALENRF